MGAILGDPGFRGACSTWRSDARDRKPRSRQWTRRWLLGSRPSPLGLRVPHNPPPPWWKGQTGKVNKLLPPLSRIGAPGFSRQVSENWYRWQSPRTPPSRFCSAVMEANMNGRMASPGTAALAKSSAAELSKPNQQLCVIEAHSQDLIRAPSWSR